MPFFRPPALADQPPRDRVLLTAHQLFYRDGIRATGVDRVIAESGVAKVTFYRHFPSKDALILAYLDFRHSHWMAWFTGALQRHAPAHPGLQALVPTLREWFEDEGFRGCAFINGLIELGETRPEVVEVTRRHKEDMTRAIAELLPPGEGRWQDAQTVVLAVDGAIIHAQVARGVEGAEGALASLGRLLGGRQAVQAA